MYDRIYGARFVPDAAVAALGAAAGDGPVLELGLGTGRLAVPLTEQGVPVDGIEASSAMVAQLRAQPGGAAVGVFQVDLDGFELPRHDYAVAVCAVSTLFMLPSAAAQARCVAAAGRHLRAGGTLFVEAFRPDPSRFDAAGHPESTPAQRTPSHRGCPPTQPDTSTLRPRWAGQVLGWVASVPSTDTDRPRHGGLRPTLGRRARVDGAIRQRVKATPLLPYLGVTVCTRRHGGPGLDRAPADL